MTAEVTTVDPGPHLISVVIPVYAGELTLPGLVDEILGRLGLLLDRPEAPARIERAIAFYERHGWVPYAQRATAALAASDTGSKRPDEALD